MKKRAAIYSRVSTDDQADRGYSLPSQLNACCTYAEQMGYSVVAEFREDYSGAVPVENRPQGRRLTEMIKSREVDAVIVYQVDRLSRDIVDLLTTVRNWLRAGMDVFALDVGKIDSELDIVLLIRGWQGGDERRKMRERSMRGKRAKAASGRVVGTRAPYGYQHVRDENNKVVNFEALEVEAKIVRLIYQWYVNGDEKGKRLSAGAIAKRLSEMKIPTPGETNSGYHRKREAGMWHAFGVIEIISREVYAGIWRYGVRIGPTRNKRSEEEWIDVEVPPLVDRDLWDKAQNQRILNKQFSRRNAKHDYLLSGMIRCACGRAMSGEFFSNHQYYTCTLRNSQHSQREERTCTARAVRADAVEVDVWASIEGLFTDLRKLEHHLLLAQKEELESINPKIEELNALETMIVSTELEAIEIGQALRHASGVVAKGIEQDMAEVNMRYEALCKRRDELTEDLSVTHLTDTAIQELLEFSQDISIGIENADFETKRRNLQLLKVRVMVNKGTFTINCIAGVISGEIRKLPRATKGKYRNCIIETLLSLPMANVARP